MNEFNPTGQRVEPRPEKVAVVEEVTAKLSEAQAVIVTEYRGMSVGQLAGLRRTLKDVGGEYKVYKNSLAKFAAERAGVESLKDLLVGPSAITFVAGDAAAVAKALRDVARVNPLLIIKGGSMGGKALSGKDVEALAELPSREVLLARFAGALQAPLVKTAGLLQALPRNMAYGLKALIDQRAAEAA
jgi:large subunit ribosomal protein L10